MNCGSGSLYSTFVPWVYTRGAFLTIADLTISFMCRLILSTGWVATLPLIRSFRYLFSNRQSDVVRRRTFLGRLLFCWRSVSFLISRRLCVERRVHRLPIDKHLAKLNLNQKPALPHWSVPTRYCCVAPLLVVRRFDGHHSYDNHSFTDAGYCLSLYVGQGGVALAAGHIRYLSLRCLLVAREARLSTIKRICGVGPASRAVVKADQGLLAGRVIVRAM
jgi:hypothetical protein